MQPPRAQVTQVESWWKQAPNFLQGVAALLAILSCIGTALWANAMRLNALEYFQAVSERRHTRYDALFTERAELLTTLREFRAEQRARDEATQKRLERIERTLDEWKGRQ